MTKSYYCNITEHEISVNAALAFANDETHGGTCSFIGTIRNYNLGKEVIGVSYDVHDKLVQKYL